MVEIILWWTIMFADLSILAVTVYKIIHRHFCPRIIMGNSDFFPVSKKEFLEKYFKKRFEFVVELPSGQHHEINIALKQIEEDGQGKGLITVLSERNKPGKKITSLPYRIPEEARWVYDMNKTVYFADLMCLIAFRSLMKV
jgi:hypothetical protein